MESSIIRPYRSPDRTDVIRLFREFMQELTPPQLRSEFESYVDTAVREELGRIEQYYFSREGQGFWVAGQSGVVGMAGVERHSESSAELRRMAVFKSHRRRGIARELLQVAEAFCRDFGYRTVVLSTSELQIPAMRLYESSGYRLLRTEISADPSHKTVGAGLTRYHYEKSLSPGA